MENSLHLQEISCWHFQFYCKLPIMSIIIKYVSIIRFILAGFFTIHDPTLTAVNIAVMLVGVVPKLHFFHGFRLSKFLSQNNDKDQ